MKVAPNKEVEKSYSKNNSCHDYHMTSSQRAKKLKKICKM